MQKYIDDKEIITNMNDNRMESIEQLSDSGIERRIYVVRGEQVMIDRDLADLYGVENRVLRQAVRRNKEKFPDDFLFKLTEPESNELILRGVSQSVIPPGYNTGGTQMFAFTEQGVAMLSTVLRSPNASSVSVAIMRAFVMMRRFITTNAGIFQRLSDLERKQLNTDEKIDKVLNSIWILISITNSMRQFLLRRYPMQFMTDI